MGRRIALLIGNSTYDDAAHYHELLTPIQNVQDLERVLADPERGEFEVIARINTSRSDAERQIHKLFKGKAQDDCLVLYFTGHGLKDANDALYFAMKETEYEDIEITSVAASFVKDCIEKCNSEHIVVILDCCFSGAFADMLSGYGRAVLTATDAIQYAWDYNADEAGETAKNSVFTHYLVEGLASGDADDDGDGEVTLDELFAYVYERTVRTHPEQTPTKKTHQAVGNLALAKNPTPNKLSRDLLVCVAHPHYHMRLGAIIALEEILYQPDGQRQQLVEKAQNALQQLSKDGNPLVAKEASAVLEDFRQRSASQHNAADSPKIIRQMMLFISAPDDVLAEKEIVYRVVERLNADSTLSAQAHISVVAWDDPQAYISMIAGSNAHQTGPLRQEIVPPSECDIFVAPFWSTMGASLPAEVVKADGTKYESVNEWMYEDALNGAANGNGRPTLLLYRSDQPIIRRNERNRLEKIAQFRKVEHFFSTLRAPAGPLARVYRMYSNLEHFEMMLEKNLRVVIRKLVTDVPLLQDRATERETLAETIEQSETDALIRSYLYWIIEQHSRLELRGLGGDTRLPTIPLEKVYVALKGSRASAYEREQSQELLHAEANDFIAERGVEVSASNLALLMFFADRKALLQNPYMPSQVELDRPGDAVNLVGDKTSVVTLGDAFRTERWMVILGDPGSGKTTLARWIALKLASAWLDGENAVIVPAYQVDPTMEKSDEGMVNIGPTRLPILLRVSEFAEAYQYHKDHPGSEAWSIVDFLGYHSWLQQSPPLSKQKLNAVIRRYLQAGRVVVILDGMDEITEIRQRDEVVSAIETFIKYWINARGKTVSPQELDFLWNPLVLGEPATNGGNQIIITSRIAGYKAKPITGSVTHVTIQPMERIAVEHFCDAWTLAVHQLLNIPEQSLSSETLQQRARIEADGLKAAIFDEQRLRVRELASNPLLVTILALVYRKQGRLPEQRAELYHRAMEILIEAWRATGITTTELIYVLSPLAERIHQKYAKGMIETNEMKEIITNALAKFRGLDPLDPPPAFVLEVKEFMRQVQEDVGLLAERGQGLYGFLHLTFQEYLAALYLIRDKRHAPEAIIGKLDDPRWREPILMALGHISVSDDWGPEASHHLLTALLNADDPLGDLIPRSALLIVSAIPEMARVSEDVVREIIRRLMTTYADRDGIGQFSTLRARISKGLQDLSRSKQRGLLEQFLAGALLAIEKGDRNLALASASLIAVHQWQSDILLNALIKAFPYDEAAWDYPITRTLQAMALLPAEIAKIPIMPVMDQATWETLQDLEERIQKINDGSLEAELEKRGEDEEARKELEELQSGVLLTHTEEEIAALKEGQQRRLDAYQSEADEYEQIVHERLGNSVSALQALPFRKALRDDYRLVEYVEENLPWLRLVVLLYGGISDYGLADYAMQDDEISTVFRLEKVQRGHYIARLRERAYWKKSWDKDDVVYNLAVHLDVDHGKLLDAAQWYAADFTPLAIFNDSPLTPIFLQALRQKKDPATLKARLWQEWRSSGQYVRRAHALLALLLLDSEPAIDALAQSLKDTKTYVLAEMVLNLLRMRKQALAGPLFLLGKKEQIGTSLEPLVKNFMNTQAQWTDLVALFFRTFTSVTPLPVGPGKVLIDGAMSIPRLNAELWAFWLSGLGGDDQLYSYAVILDTLGRHLQSASALINIHQAYNSRYNYLTQWYPLLIPPDYEDYADVVGDALTVAHQSRSRVMKGLFYSGTMTFAWINQPECPGLKEDALAAALLIPPEFQQMMVAEIDAELAQSSTYEMTIIERVMKIDNPIIKARALWRLAHRYKYWQQLSLRDLAIEAAGQIDEPLHRSRAFEYLINAVPLRQRERCKKEALDAARKISDPNNLARALARLALYEGNEKRWSLLADALTASRHISDEQQQIETLQLLHSHLAENSQLEQIYVEIINNVKDEWSRHKGQNRLSVHLLALHAQLHEPQKLTPVVLAALIDDVVDLKPEAARSDDLWRQLLDPGKREHALAALLKEAAANGLDGLYLNSHVFDIIVALLDEQEIAFIYPLLPYLRGVEPSLVPALNRWVEKAPDPLLQVYSGLLLAETGQVDTQTIPCLLNLIENGVDFGRYRAGLVLHSPDISTNKRGRDFRTSQLGLQAILLLAQALTRLFEEKEHVATPLTWAWDNLLHDSPEILRNLILLAEDDKEEQSGIRSILGHISYCDDSCLQVIIEEFAKGSEKIQKLLLWSWVNLSQEHFRQHISVLDEARMNAAIAALPASMLDDFKAIPARQSTISKLLRSVGERVEKQQLALPAAIPFLDQELAAAAVHFSEISTKTWTLHAYYWFSHDPQRALDEAQNISKNSAALELLFGWLAASLRENINDVPPDYYRISTLLELAAAATHFSPAAIYNLCAKHELGPLLIRVAMEHETFWGRASAATLLGYLRQTPEAFDQALLGCLQDVAEVQSAAMQMVQNLHYLDERIIPQMIELLEHEDASVIYAIARVLTSIARNEKIDLALRQKIVRALNDTIQRKDSLRPVFTSNYSEGDVFITPIGRLDQQLY